MEGINYTDSGGGHARLPQSSTTDEYDHEYAAITTRWTNQQPYTTRESENVTQIAPHQVVYQSPPGYDSYRPDYSDETTTYRSSYGGKTTTYRPNYGGETTTYRPNYSCDTISNVGYGQDEEIGITGRSLSDSYQPRYERRTRFRHKLDYINTESTHHMQARNGSRPLSSQDTAAAGSPDEISLESLDLKRLASTQRGYRDSRREKAKAVNLLQEVQKAEKAEKARVERGGPHIPDFISRSRLPGTSVTKVRKVKEKKKSPPAQQPKQQPDRPAFTIWEEGWLRDEVTGALDFLASPATAKMPRITLEYHRRRLKALQLTLEDMERDGVKAQNLAKSQLHIRFFERQLCAKFLEQLALERDVILDSPQQNQQALQNIGHKIHEAEVDFNYALYYPVLEQYDRIFDGTNRPKRLHHTYQPGIGIQSAPAIVKKKYKRPPLWDWVARYMSEGTVEGLRFAHLKRTGDGQIVIVEMGSVVADANKNETKWQVANPADLDVENKYDDDEEFDRGNDQAKEDEDSDSDDGGGVRIYNPDISDSLRYLRLR